MTTQGPGDAGPRRTTMNQLQLPDLTTFLTCLSVFVPLFGGAGIVLGALGWLSDRITIGGPRTR